MVSRTDRNSQGAARPGTATRLILFGLMITAGATSVSALRPASHVAPARDDSPPQSGVYTSAQAQRGQGSFLNYCASCHRDDLSGFSTIPPLKGDNFRKAWNGRTVDDLYSFIRSGMPPYNSTPIARQVYLDIVAFILQSNSLPPGMDELVPDSALLKTPLMPKDDSPR